MKTILSTKKLSHAQKELLINEGISVVDYNAIKIEFTDFELDTTTKNVIFTSQNGVRAYLNKLTNSLGDSQVSDSKERIRCFCVGEKTKSFLEENGHNVVEMTENALKLGNIIAKRYKNESFLFYCGNRKREELPLFLKDNQIALKELVVYSNTLNTKVFEGSFDGVLFFSPSAMESYALTNNIAQSTAFCIGSTTADEVKKYTKNTIQANTPTIENVMAQVIKYYSKKRYDSTKGNNNII